MSVQLIRGNALALPIEDSTVDLVVTSPPYFGLRSYQDAGEHYDGQIGAEATPAEFVDALIAATREMVRVLKPSGSIWVNLGDKYQATSFAPQQRGKDTPGTPRPTVTKPCERCGESFTGGPGRRFCSAYCGGSDNSPRASRGGIPTKSLMGIPWRYAIRCIDDLGLILRAEVIWSKPNGLPESVTDRVRRSHEQWFHFTKEPRYYSAVDEVREAHASPLHAPGNKSALYESQAELSATQRGRHQFDPSEVGRTWGNPLGKLPGSVWTIATEPLRVPDHLGIDHFAAFPTEWPRRIITGWSPRGVCVECGAGRRPVVEKNDQTVSKYATALAEQYRSRGVPISGGTESSTLGPRMDRSVTLIGEACDCPEPTAPTTPGVVLDPFGGTGTTALVADALGRHGISVDMSQDYCRLAEWRTSDPKQMAKAARRDYQEPTPQVEGQSPLFDIELPQKPPPDKFHRTGWQNGPVDRSAYKCRGCGHEKQYADVSRPCPSCGAAT